MILGNTDELFITRKRKKWKFAHFDSYENCFEYVRDAATKEIKRSIQDYLPENEALILELAAGNAQFSLNLARLHPRCNFVAVDIKSDRLYQSAKQALEQGVKNIAFLRTEMSDVGKLFKKHTANIVWLTFPDPYLKTRNTKKRLTYAKYLRLYRDLLKKEGELKFKTDNRDLFLWSLEQFVAEKWHINEISFDLHESDLSSEYKIMTRYEEIFTAQETPINFVSLTTR